MDQPKTDKFSELSPVLELVYVMLTNMAKYIDVYATDIEAEKLEQYMEARDALKNAIAKFDVLYGLQSPSSTPSTVEEEQLEEVVSSPVAPATPTELQQEEPVSQEQSVSAAPSTESHNYEFASGDDPESMRKAKQAVEELKALFADMKKQEAPAEEQVQSPVEQPVATVAPTTPVTVAPTPEPTPSITPNMPMPTFVTPPAQPTTPAPVAQYVPTPMNTPPVAQDANEVDSILEELRKLQNKGTTQL